MTYIIIAQIHRISKKGEQHNVIMPRHTGSQHDNQSNKYKDQILCRNITSNKQDKFKLILILVRLSENIV